MNVKSIAQVLGVTVLAIGSAGFLSPTVRANPTPAAPSQPEQIQAQVNSIRQLRDVSPQDWSYEALKNLVEGYGCIVGYPDRTYRGQRALTRDEFAAGLNACLQQLERRRLSQSGTSPSAALPNDPMLKAPGDSLNNVFNRGFFNDTGTFYDSTGISGQANQIFGWRTFPGSYSDNQVKNDAQVVNTLYKDAMRQQSEGRIVRTRDLDNPYNTSLREDDAYLQLQSPAPVGGSTSAPFRPY